jgi:hypothetical protein
MEAAPVYEFAIRFFPKYLGLNYETGLKYLRLGIITPDAFIGADRRPLFATDLLSVERHISAIDAYKGRTRAVRFNVQLLAHSSAN